MSGIQFSGEIERRSPQVSSIVQEQLKIISRRSQESFSKTPEPFKRKIKEEDSWKKMPLKKKLKVEYDEDDERYLPSTSQQSKPHTISRRKSSDEEIQIIEKDESISATSERKIKKPKQSKRKCSKDKEVRKNKDDDDDRSPSTSRGRQIMSTSKPSRRY